MGNRDPVAVSFRHLRHVVVVRGVLRIVEDVQCVFLELRRAADVSVPAAALRGGMGTRSRAPAAGAGGAGEDSRHRSEAA